VYSNKRQDGHDNDHKADKIDDAVHKALHWMDEAERPLNRPPNAHQAAEFRTATQGFRLWMT